LGKVLLNRFGRPECGRQVQNPSRNIPGGRDHGRYCGPQGHVEMSGTYAKPGTPETKPQQAGVPEFRSRTENVRTSFAKPIIARKHSERTFGNDSELQERSFAAGQRGLSHAPICAATARATSISAPPR